MDGQEVAHAGHHAYPLLLDAGAAAVDPHDLPTRLVDARDGETVPLLRQLRRGLGRPDVVDAIEIEDVLLERPELGDGPADALRDQRHDYELDLAERRRRHARLAEGAPDGQHGVDLLLSVRAAHRAEAWSWSWSMLASRTDGRRSARPMVKQRTGLRAMNK